MTEKKKAAAVPIAIEGLTKRYGAAVALDHIDLDVRSGEFLTLLGPSGSGKTTLLMALAGFVRPDSGSLRFGGVETVCAPPHKRGVGMVFQSYALFPHMNVAENIGFALRLRKVPRDEIARRVDEALETVELGGYGARSVAQLSGGQRQRVALARAIVFDPGILLMDEPLSALDKKLREHMQVELRRLHEKLGMTTVYVTHDQREALSMSDRIAVIHRGKVMQIGTPGELYEQPANRFVADFIGESAFLPIEVRDGVACYAGRPLRLQTGADACRDKLLMLRPERLSVMTGEAHADMNVFRGTVSSLAYHGDSYLLQVVLEGGASISVRGVCRGHASAGMPGKGDAITLGMHRQDTVLVADA